MDSYYVWSFCNVMQYLMRICIQMGPSLVQNLRVPFSVYTQNGTLINVMSGDVTWCHVMKVHLCRQTDEERDGFILCLELLQHQYFMRICIQMGPGLVQDLRVPFRFACKCASLFFWFLVDCFLSLYVHILCQELLQNVTVSCNILWTP